MITIDSLTKKYRSSTAVNTDGVQMVVLTWSSCPRKWTDGFSFNRTGPAPPVSR